uniref:Uncharacterized protein n=1 Tax=Plectus sambesii TaxID=2011161 RepID=A0A914XC08_9BILA
MRFVLIASIIAVSYVSMYEAQVVATGPPCCRNLLGQQSCNFLHKTNAIKFINRCNYEVDFRVIQCCQLCDVIASNSVVNGVPQSYENAVQRMFSEGSGQCFDRMSSTYCLNFVQRTGPWQGANQWSCAAQHAPLAFRICRLSCGYCSITNTTAPSVPLTSYTQTNAYASCSLN